MKVIENLNLAEIVETTAQHFIDEKRKSVAGMIKQMFQAADQLATDIQNREKELTKKKQSLGEITAKIEKLKSGDWSVLVEPKQPGEPKVGPAENPAE